MTSERAERGSPSYVHWRSSAGCRSSSPVVCWAAACAEPRRPPRGGRPQRSPWRLRQDEVNNMSAKTNIYRREEWFVLEEQLSFPSMLDIFTNFFDWHLYPSQDSIHNVAARCAVKLVKLLWKTLTVGTVEEEEELWSITSSLGGNSDWALRANDATSASLHASFN